jgi:hypothetical protein
MNESPPNLIRLAEFARLMGVSRSATNHWRKKGLPLVGGLVDEAAGREWVKKNIVKQWHNDHPERFRSRGRKAKGQTPQQPSQPRDATASKPELPKLEPTKPVAPPPAAMTSTRDPISIDGVSVTDPNLVDKLRQTLDLNDVDKLRKLLDSQKLAIANAKEAGDLVQVDDVSALLREHVHAVVTRLAGLPMRIAEAVLKAINQPMDLQGEVAAAVEPIIDDVRRQIAQTPLEVPK